MTHGVTSSHRVVTDAVGRLSELGRVTCSPIYGSPAVPAGSGPDFVNGVARIDTGLGPEELLGELHNLEDIFDRKRGLRWGPRTLDLDLLAWGDAVLPDAATQDAWRALPFDEQRVTTPETLILPHPRLQDRAFVLKPWADIDPDWRHPRIGATVAELLEALPDADRTAVRPLGPA